MVETFVTEAGYESAISEHITRIQTTNYQLDGVAMLMRDRLRLTRLPDLGATALLVYCQSPDLSEEDNPRLTALQPQSPILHADPLEPQRSVPLSAITRPILEVVTNEWHPSLTHALVHSLAEDRLHDVSPVASRFALGKVLQRGPQGARHLGASPLDAGHVQQVAEEAAERFPEALYTHRRPPRIAQPWYAGGSPYPRY